MPGLHGKIIRQALMLAKGHKTFWRLGLLLSWPLAAKSAAIILLSVWGIKAYRPDVELGPFAETGPGNPWLGAVALLASIIFALLHYRSAAIVMFRVKQLRSSRQSNETAVDQAEPYTIPLLKLGAGFAAAIASALAVFSSPAAYMFSQESSGPGMALGILGLAIAVPTLLVLYAASVFSPMSVALHGMPALPAVRVSLDLVRRTWPSLLSFLVLVGLLELLGMAVSFALGSAVSALFVLLFAVFYDMYGLFAPGVAQGLAGTLGFMVFFMSLAWVSAFRRIAWTVLFLETARPVKPVEQAEEEPLPETVT